MRKMLEWVRKFNTPLYYGIICAVFGIAFIALPLTSPVALDILIIVAGVAAIVIGVLMVAELDTPDRGLSYYLAVAKTIGFIALGVFLITARSALATHFCFVFGVYMILRALPSFIKSILFPATTTVAWWVRLVLLIFEITLGAWLIFYPRWPHILSGIMLLLIAVDLLVKHYKKDRPASTTTRDGTLYDLDFEDKS